MYSLFNSHPVGVITDRDVERSSPTIIERGSFYAEKGASV
jgi:hypothetical protein